MPLADCEDLAMLVAVLFHRIACWIREDATGTPPTKPSLSECTEWCPTIATVSLSTGGSHSVCVLEHCETHRRILMEGTAPVGVHDKVERRSLPILRAFARSGQSDIVSDIEQTYGQYRAAWLQDALGFYNHVHQVCTLECCYTLNEPQNFAEYLGSEQSLQDRVRAGRCLDMKTTIDDNVIDLYFLFHTVTDPLKDIDASARTVYDEKLRGAPRACIVNGCPALAVHEFVKGKCATTQCEVARQWDVYIVCLLGLQFCVMAVPSQSRTGFQ